MNIRMRVIHAVYLYTMDVVSMRVLIWKEYKNYEKLSTNDLSSVSLDR